MSGDRRVEVALAVVRQGDRVLIGQRPPGGPLAGYWEFPGGKILSGESPQEAAARECREETGLEIRVLDLLSLVDHDYPHGPVRLHFFAAELRNPPRPSVGSGAVRGSPGPARVPTEGLPEGEETRGRTSGGVNSPMPSVEPAPNTHPAPGAAHAHVPAAPFCWIAAAELPSYRFPPANAGVIQRIIADSQGPV